MTMIVIGIIIAILYFVSSFYTQNDNTHKAYLVMARQLVKIWDAINGGSPIAGWFFLGKILSKNG